MSPKEKLYGDIIDSLANRNISFALYRAPEDKNIHFLAQPPATSGRFTT